jgi:hypothetical protein
MNLLQSPFPGVRARMLLTFPAAGPAMAVAPRSRCWYIYAIGRRREPAAWAQMRQEER